ncbi:unnamed protein product [Thelazia callipaeda]|uniref:Reverse transcriptase n=1 Tax=Thelazia callipaeda TaxID=103827 RepID=A0A0N5D731_THECL|nr:unnamed protein product [Thelazia callipaeda]
MGPNPVEHDQNRPEQYDIDSDGKVVLLICRLEFVDSGRNDNVWHVGYGVEMHGDGFEEYTTGRSDATDSETDTVDADNASDIESDQSDNNDSDSDRYVGYHSLPTCDFSSEAGDIDYGRANVIIERDFEEALSTATFVHSQGSDFKIIDKPKPIEMTADNIECIKKAMSSFTLPAPAWVEDIGTDNELKKLVERLMPKKTS